MKITVVALVSIAVIIASLCGAFAALVIPSDGSDGVFNPTANVQVDLSQAVTGTWNQDNSANAGKGVYDPEKWAVVFKYSSINIPSGVTVTFKNHPSRAPVVWLVSGSAVIAGTVNLDGQNDQGIVPSEPGPGGFRGGRKAAGSLTYSAGFGPGGAGYDLGSPGGSYATPGCGVYAGDLYGWGKVMPLLGGSGGAPGAGQYGESGGGAGGGALLVGLAESLEMSGQIRANGGYGGQYGGNGSGGAVRIIADAISGTGQLSAAGGDGSNGMGWIRVETNSDPRGWSSNPAYSPVPPDSPPMIWPDAGSPSITVVSLGGTIVLADPCSEFMPNSDVKLQNAGIKTAVIEAKNVPVDGAWTVEVRVVPYAGQDWKVQATLVSGDLALSTWQADIDLPEGEAAIQAGARQVQQP